MLNVGDCNMSEDIMTMKLEYKNGNCDQKATLYTCLCYMTVEGTEGVAEYKKKCDDIVQRFVEEHKEEYVLVMGDILIHQLL